MKTIIILLAVSLLGILSSCKEKKNNSALTEKKVEVKTEPVQTAQPAPKPAEKQQPVKKKNYHLVAGCFMEEENAQRLHAQLTKEGYDSQIIPFYNLQMVTYNSFETRQEAQNTLNLIVQETGKELTWVYPVK